MKSKTKKKACQKKKYDRLNLSIYTDIISILSIIKNKFL